jgi:hypothetical protein
VFLVVAAAAAAYVVMAYVVMPLAWKEDARRHASFEGSARITETKDGHPGDPLNVALIGTELELSAVMQAARWAPAAALGLESDLEIAADAVLARPDAKAPVSNLYLFGRKQDLAYEQQVGKDPRHRHHVRFWRMDELGHDGRPVWIGSAAYDEGVGLSRATGQITHHIAADVDAERDYLFHDLERSGDLSEAYPVEGFHETREGRNGGGDPWHTDGDLRVGVVEPDL